MKVLEMLGIYGWKPETENLLLASLLTGDPILLVGRHGCAKTHVACKLAEALQKNFVAYDASKTLFDDVLGYPDIEKMKQGKIEYLPSKVTVWDKEMILVNLSRHCHRWRRPPSTFWKNSSSASSGQTFR